MSKRNILVTGSEGQVGQEIRAIVEEFANFKFLFVDVDKLDITNSDAVSSFFENNSIGYCINCAAYTAVDRAEEEPHMAHLVNVIGVKNLAENCALRKAKLIQISTDYVYHTLKNTPFLEGDSTDPKGVYASTKLEGDEIALNFGGMVVRTSWVYSAFGNNFVKTMLRLGAERDELGVVFDQIGTPTYAADLAAVILKIIKSDLESPFNFNQVYHFSNEGVTSWYDFAKAIFEVKGIKIKVRPIETNEYPTPAQRPPFSVLNKSKIKLQFGIEIPYWRESLIKCLEKL